MLLFLERATKYSKEKIQKGRLEHRLKESHPLNASPGHPSQIHSPNTGTNVNPKKYMLT